MDYFAKIEQKVDLISTAASGGVIRLPFGHQIATGDEIEYAGLAGADLAPDYNWKRVGDGIAAKQHPDAKPDGNARAVSHKHGIPAIVEAAIRVLRGQQKETDPTVLAKAFLELNAPDRLLQLRSELERAIVRSQAVDDFGKAIDHASQVGNLNLADWIVPHGETWHFEKNGYYGDCDPALLYRLGKQVGQLDDSFYPSHNGDPWGERMRQGGIVWCVHASPHCNGPFPDAVVMMMTDGRPQLVYYDRFDSKEQYEVNCGRLPEGGTAPIPATKMAVVRSLFFIGLLPANPSPDFDAMD